MALVIAASAAAQKSSDSPEPVIRGLVRAMYSNDVAAFKRLTVPNSRIGLLTTGGRVNQDGLRELDEDPGGLQIIMKRRFEYRGVAAKPDAAGKYPIGTTAVYVVAHHRNPIVMVVQKQQSPVGDILLEEISGRHYQFCSCFAQLAFAHR